MAKILIVDDMTGIRRSLSVILSGCGYEIIEAENGIKAMEALKSSDDVDLIITDILMPEADGIELMTKIQKFEKRPKLIAISGGGNRVTAENALDIAQVFADVVLRKPFQREDLVRHVEHVLGQAA